MVSKYTICILFIDCMNCDIVAKMLHVKISTFFGSCKYCILKTQITFHLSSRLKCSSTQKSTTARISADSFIPYLHLSRILSFC